jgi:hypothetical protein
LLELRYYRPQNSSRRREKFSLLSESKKIAAWATPKKYQDGTGKHNTMIFSYFSVEGKGV